MSAQAEVEHAHRWLIETPNGAPQVNATCRTCGVERPFYASSYRDGSYHSFLDRDGVHPNTKRRAKQ